LRWVKVVLQVATLSYTIVALSSWLTRRHLTPAAWLEPFVALCCGVGLWLVRRNRVQWGGYLGLSAIWAELTWTLYVQSGVPSTSIGVFPLLVLAVGLLLGESAVWIFTPLVAVVTPLAALLGPGASEHLAKHPTTLFHNWLIFVLQVLASGVIVLAALRTVRRLLESERSVRARFVDLFQQAHDGLIALTPEGTVEAVNLSALRLLERTEAEVVARPLCQVLEEWGIPAGLCAQLLDFGREHHDRSVRLVNPTNHPQLWVELATSQRVLGERDSGLQLVLRDVSERIAVEAEQRRLSEQLQHAQKLEIVGRLAGSVAHDFNNLLTAVGGCAELLVVQTEGEPKQLAHEILHATQHGVTLTRQLLSFSRREILQPAVVDVSEIARRAQRLLGRIVGERHRLITTLAPECRILADPGQVEQVLVNLVANARDAMPDPGKIEVGVRRLEESIESVELTVKDTGVGIPEANLHRIFEPFFTTKGQGRGTGLGLATVQSIVDGWGGTVDCRSRLGVGTTFTVRIPSVPRLVGEAEREETPEIVVGHGERILVVDDEAAVCGLLERILRAAGYRVQATPHPLEAERIALAADFDLLLLDVMMPVRLGTELAEIVRRSRPDQAILFMSGWIDPEVAQSVALNPEENLLTKPFSAEQLRRRVQSSLRNAPPRTRR